MPDPPVKSPRKLIEVALPLDAIHAACAWEDSIRHGHPSTLHLWWAGGPWQSRASSSSPSSSMIPPTSRAAVSDTSTTERRPPSNESGSSKSSRISSSAKHHRRRGPRTHPRHSPPRHLRKRLRPQTQTQYTAIMTANPPLGFGVSGKPVKSFGIPRRVRRCSRRRNRSGRFTEPGSAPSGRILWLVVSRLKSTPKSAHLPPEQAPVLPPLNSSAGKSKTCSTALNRTYHSSPGGLGPPPAVEQRGNVHFL